MNCFYMIEFEVVASLKAPILLSLFLSSLYHYHKDLVEILIQEEFPSLLLMNK